MTGARLPYLERRQGIWNLRVRVPDSVRLRVGVREIRRSLKTYSPTRARLLAARLTPQLQEIFRMAQNDLMTKDEVRALVETCFQHLAGETETHSPSFTDPPREVDDQRRMVDERLQDLRRQIRGGDFEADVKAKAAELLRHRGRDPSHIPPSLMRDLVEGVARALAEQQRLYEFRLNERLMPYEPSDPVFARIPLSTAPSEPTYSIAPPPVIGPTVREAVDR